jgi:CheY-like chemotaxis protein
VNRNVLFIDDEQNVLEGIKRQLRRSFDITTALGAAEGLTALLGKTEFAVIVSDMRMPGKDGTQFLAEAQKICPNSIRMMLTGDSDQQTAIHAVNKGNIFRFLTKPCEPQALIANVEAGLRQYELVTGEKELLEKTLSGSIQVLVDILALSNPAAFSRAERIKYYVQKGAQAMGLPNGWQLEVAALLSQIGYVTVPTEIMEKHFAGDTLTDKEKEMLSRHSSEACKLIKKIPRLEAVAGMIEIKETVPPDPSDDPILLGAQLLRCAKALDIQVSTGISIAQAAQNLRLHPADYNRAMLNVLEKVEPHMAKQSVRLVQICDLRPDMILAEDVRSGTTLIVTKGQVVSHLMRHRLENFVIQKAIDPEVRVYVNT